ncbi:MAG: GAF domain-containing protein [Dehalococcoidales bacterium]
MEKREQRYYTSLYKIAAVINSARTPEAVLNSIVESVAKALEVKGSSIMLLEPDKKLLIHRAAYGLSEQYIKKGPVSADKSIAEALRGQPVAVLDATTDERVQYRESAKKEGIASVLSVPMKRRGEIIGVVRVYTTEPCQFTKDDMYFVGAVANLGAIALENAKLYETLQKEYEAFRLEMLEWRAALGREWRAHKSVIPPEEWE